MTDRPSVNQVGLVALAGLLVASALTGCSDRGSPDTEPSPTPTPTATPTPPPTATAAPLPRPDRCFVLTYEQAVSPTNDAGSVRCRSEHTSQTYAVGEVDNVVEGHLLAIDSARVQDQVATDCPAALGDAVGGSVEDRRLSMLRAVWFTPSLEESDAGASWYRCDVVALAGTDRLAPVTGSLTDVLDTPEGRERFAMCGTASPDEPDFERVPCTAEHTWRAFEVVDLEPGDYPGPEAVAESGAGACEDAAAAVAEDPLDYEWAFEGPDAEQWGAGQTFVRCWTPD